MVLRVAFAVFAVAEKKAFLLRLPPALHDALNRWAGDELRSLNGQIEYLLREAVRRRSGGSDDGGEGIGDGEDSVGR